MIEKQKSDSVLFKWVHQIYSAALDAVSPEKLMKDKIFVKKDQLFVSGTKFDLSEYRNIYLAAFGKSAPRMAENLLEVMGRRIKGGVFLGHKENQEALPPLIYMKAAHPLPDANSVRAAKKLISLANRMEEKDLFIVLVSGGGSSHICLPTSDVSLKEKRYVVKKLMQAGADIKELNAVRKHISLIKGGRLARAAFPATIISLYISDVIGNDLETIASGPTYWDSSTYNEAVKILKKYHIWNSSPGSIRRILIKGMQGKEIESVKKGDPVLEKSYNFIVGDNEVALKAAAEQASQMGFRVSMLSSSEQGEAREKASYYLSLLLNRKEKIKLGSRPICLVSGGELTVTVKGKGKGGRNQEFVLAFLKEVKKNRIKEGGWVVLSLGTDGIDGPTDAAGAWASLETLRRTERLSIDLEKFLAHNDSYHFFKKIGGLIKTGPTQTNVMDLRILIVK